METTMKGIALAAVLEEAERKASEAALKLIRETPSWEKCNPHREYYATEADILHPYVNWAMEKYSAEFETTQYAEGLITGREYLSALVLKTT